MQKLIRPCGLHCIKIKHLGVSFADHIILEDVNLHIHCGSLTAIIGENGAGKSTLARAILGEIPYTGSIEFRNTKDGVIKKMKVGYVPQNLNIDKNSPMDVYDLMTSFCYRLPLFIYSKRIEKEIRSALIDFDAENLLHQRIDSLSGGQLQRVLLAMSVIDSPDLLLLDEPVSGIDQNGMTMFYEKMKFLKEHQDLAIIVISHDLDYVSKYADTVILLDKTIEASGSPAEVFQSEAFHHIFGNVVFEASKKSPNRIQPLKEQPFDPMYRPTEVTEED